MLGAEEGVSRDRGEQEVWPEPESLHTSCPQTRLRSRVPMVMRLAPPAAAAAPATSRVPGKMHAGKPRTSPGRSVTRTQRQRGYPDVSQLLSPLAETQAQPPPGP